MPRLTFRLAAIFTLLVIPHVAPAQLLFVSNEGSRNVSVVDAAARRVVATIPVGERPRGSRCRRTGGACTWR